MSNLAILRFLAKSLNLKLNHLAVTVILSSIFGGLLVYAFAPFVSIVLMGNNLNKFQPVEDLFLVLKGMFPELTMPFMLGGALCIIACLNGFFQYFKLVLFNEFCQGLVERLSNTFFKGYLNREYIKVKSTDQKKLENLILVETYQVMNYFVRPLIEMCSAFTAISAILIAILFVDYRIIYLFLCLSVMLIMVYVVVRQKFLLLGTVRQESQESKHLILNESFQSYKDVKYYSQEELVGSRFESVTKNIKTSEVFANVSAELPKLVLEAVVPILVVAFGLVAFVATGNDDGFVLTSIAVLGLALAKMLPDVSRAYRSISLIKYSGPICDVILEELSQVSMGIKQKNSSNYDLKFDNSIELKNLEFSFDGKNSIFKPINAKINKGDRVALIGPSGIGKSTLLDLISGLLVPWKGSIEIDSKNLQNYDTSQWMKNFSYVPQEVLLMDTDIDENISFKKDLTLFERNLIDRLVNELSLGGLISQRDVFKVGNRGQNLSGGQRQRIAIARALFFQRDIIIMDEPTSALDKSNGQKIIELIFKEFQSKTIFVITHDTNILANFDKVIELEK